MKLICKWLFYTCLVWFLMHTLIITYIGTRNYNCQSQIGIILGNKVNEDGSLSLRLKARLDKGIELIKKGNVKLMIVSGGLGKEGYWEGNKMRDYLILNGIPDSVIIVDNFGTNTEASAVNSKHIADSLGAKQITVISQFYHLQRSKLLFEKYGFHSICLASPYYFEWKDGYSLVREFFAYYWILIRDGFN